MNETALAKKEKQELSPSQRFMNKVVSEFSSSVGAIALTNFQQRLAQNYFIAIDAALKAAEEKRLVKSEKYRDPLPVIWANVNMEKLARDVVAYARVGFDPAQKNHISMIPFKNNKSGKYDIVFIEGYRGIELKATKYGLDVPDAVIVEVVYSNDKFRPIKKDWKNAVESYEFEIVSPFDRGEIVGGFYYHIYTKSPEKNKLVVMSLKEILKRKPPHAASIEFWGGERDVWEEDPQTGKRKKIGTEKVEGWFEKMVHKTIFRAAYNDITIDSQKIDDDYLRLKQLEAEYAEAEVAREIAENANREVIDITPKQENDQQEETEPKQEPPVDEPQPTQEPEPNDDLAQAMIDFEKEEAAAAGVSGPGF